MTTASSNARGPHPQWQRPWPGTIKRGDLNAIHRERGGLVSWAWAQISTSAAPEFRQRRTRVFFRLRQCSHRRQPKIQPKVSLRQCSHWYQPQNQPKASPPPPWLASEAPLSSPPSASRLGDPIPGFFGVVAKNAAFASKVPLVNRPFWGPT